MYALKVKVMGPQDLTEFDTSLMFSRMTVIGVSECVGVHACVPLPLDDLGVVKLKVSETPQGHKELKDELMQRMPYLGSVGIGRLKWFLN